MGLDKIVGEILKVRSAEALFKKINEKTKQVWDACSPNVRTEISARLSPMNINLGNALESAMDLHSWLAEVGSSNESRLKCLEEKDRVTTNLEKTHSTLDDCRTQSDAELKELNQRYGECKDLEKVKMKNEQLRNEKETCTSEKSDLREKVLELKGDRANWQAKYEELYKNGRPGWKVGVGWPFA